MTIEGTSSDDVLFGIDQGEFEPETILGGGGNDQIFAGAGLDFVYGENGDDQLFGGEDGDSLFGDNDEAGNDLLDGGSGVDSLSGGRGRDILIGGSHEDFLTGGFGSDFFVFYDVFNDGIDVISDFELARDYIVVDLNSFSYGNAGLAPNARITADQFQLGTAALDASDRFIYDNTMGHLFFDPDGTGSIAQTQIATLQWLPSISHNHIYAYQDQLPAQQTPSGTNPAMLHGQWEVAGVGTISYTFNPDGTYEVDTIGGISATSRFQIITVGQYTVDANGVITLTPLQETTKQFFGSLYSQDVKTTGLATEHKLWVPGDGARGKYILLEDAVLVNGSYQPVDPESRPSTYELIGGPRNIARPGSVAPPGQGARGGTGTAGNDNLAGTAAQDSLLGLDGNDTVTGAGGNDILQGGNGKDQLLGGAGNDQLWGGAGNDVLKGDRGRDIFVLEKGAGRDVIKDFGDRQDKLGLTSGLSFKDLKLTQRGSKTLVSAGNDQLAILSGVRINQITAADFTQI